MDKKEILALSLCVIIAFASGYLIRPYVHTMFIPPHIGNRIYISIAEPSGTRDILITNVITNIGENETGARIGQNGTYTHVRWISLGNATASATLTKLTTEATTEGAARKFGTYQNFTYSGDFAYNITATFYFTGAISFNCTGAHWSAESDSDNNMYACANFPEMQNMQNNWNMTVTWMFVFDGN